MAEALGLAASVMTLCACVIKGLQLAKDISHSPKDVQNLKGQVHIFHELMLATSQTLEVTSEGLAQKTLRRAEDLLQEIDQMLSWRSPLFGNHKEQNTLVWLRYKSKILTATSELRDIQMNILLALNLQSIGTVRRSESPLVEIQQHLAHLDMRDPLALRTTTILAGEGSSGYLSGETSSRDERLAKNIPHGNSILLAQKTTSPLTALDRSSTFVPESYTVDEFFPTIFSHRTVQLKSTEFSRTNVYSMFYRASPRKWTRVSLSLTISIESPLWGREKVKSFSFTRLELPDAIKKTLETFLRDQQPSTSRSDTYLSLYSGAQSSRQIDYPEEPKRGFIQAKGSPNHAASFFLETTSMLHHSGCLSISESKIEQIPLPIRDKRFHFISRLQSQWMFDFRFGLDRRMNEHLLYQLNAFYILRDKPGITRFIGVVTEDETKLAKGFLAKLPRFGPFFRLILEMAQSGRPVPWKRRERWCKDIARAVASVHEAGVRVGRLGISLDCGLCIDEDDRVVLYDFQPTVQYSRDFLATIPPEYYKSVEEDGQAVLPATVYTDIFQLGYTIWRIASNQGPFSPAANRVHVGYESRSLDNTPAYQLPRLEEDIPGHINAIINSCRNSDPFQRPAAWEVMSMFPHDEDDDSTRTVRNTATSSVSTGQTRNHELEDYQNLYGYFGFCDIEGTLINDCYFVCKLCRSGDYEICPTCFSQGKHCLEPDHYLTKLENHKPTGTYSSVKEDGSRHFTRRMQHVDSHGARRDSCPQTTAN